MRDTLTALAGVVILILVAALAAPPFIDWAGQRDLIDRAIGASLGLSARSEGGIGVRLLPSPRLRLDRLELGDATPGKPSLEARGVRAELALAPLLKGEFRFTETRIGRAELRLPVTEGDAILIPPDFAERIAERDLVIEDLRIGQALVTMQAPATGRTDQFLAESLHLAAPSLAGPWQAEGLSGGIPFRVATSAVAPDGGMILKVSGGGESRPRFEAEARLGLKPVDGAAAGESEPRALIPEAEGTARLVVGAAAKGTPASLSYTLGGKFKARGPVARFETVSAEIDPSGQALRLAGSGRIDLRNGRAALSLEGRRVNLDGLIYSSAGQGVIARALAGKGLGLPMMLDLDLRVESVALGFEDWSDIAFKGTFDRAGGLVLRRLSGLMPGRAALDASGELDIAPAPRFSGRLGIETQNSEGFGRYLRKLGTEGAALDLLDGRALHLAADIEASARQMRLSKLDLALGEATLSGEARFTKAPEKPSDTARGKFEAELEARGVDIAELPPLARFLPGLERYDVGLTLAARDLRYGPAGTGAGSGRIAARIQSEGTSLVVDSLDIADLAGANATLSGRIAPDGGGRIAGRVSASKAAPLVALLERVWIGEARLIPRFLREGGLALDVRLEREGGQAETLRAAAKGKAADNALDGVLLTRGGRIEALDATLSGARAGRWFGRDDLSDLRRPAEITLSGKRRDDGFALTAAGTLAGLTLATPEPLLLGAEFGPPSAGKVRIETADLSPFLVLAGSARPGAALPADLTATLSRKGEILHAEIAGRVAEAKASASLDRGADGALSGKAGFDRLSLPALSAALVLPAEGGGEEARFAKPPTHPRADLALTAERLDLGRGLVTTGAGLSLALDGETLVFRDLKGMLAGGRLSGTATLTRQGASASISGEGSLTGAAIRDLVGETPLQGRLSTALRYATSGETPSALAANLGGSGEITLADLTLPGADPAAIERALARALAEDDPLREGRAATLLSEEFSAGPLEAKGPVTAAATLVGGTLRTAPFALDLGPARWNGGLSLDLRGKRLDARGTLTAAGAPKGWSGGKPSVQLGFAGPLAAPQRAIDAGPLSNGLAALVLQRELEKIELSDADQAERQRRRARIEMDKARAAAVKAAAEKAAQEKAAQEKAAAEEAARQARQRAQQAAAEEQARRDRANAEEEARRAREAEPPPNVNDAPLDIRPPANPN